MCVGGLPDNPFTPPRTDSRVDPPNDDKAEEEEEDGESPATVAPFEREHQKRAEHMIVVIGSDCDTDDLASILSQSELSDDEHDLFPEEAPLPLTCTRTCVEVEGFVGLGTSRGSTAGGEQPVLHDCVVERAMNYLDARGTGSQLASGAAGHAKGAQVLAWSRVMGEM